MRSSGDLEVVLRGSPTKSTKLQESIVANVLTSVVASIAISRTSGALALLLAATLAHAGAADVERGRALIEKSGCAGCHAIPGVRQVGTPGRVGPPLAAFGRRLYVAGVLPNTPEQLARWIHDPLAINPDTGMPRVGLTVQESRDVAAYLLNLR
jgi:cytochrome c1